MLRTESGLAELLSEWLGIAPRLWAAVGATKSSPSGVHWDTIFKKFPAGVILQACKDAETDTVRDVHRS